MKKYLYFAFTVGGWTLLSRILGLVRDMLCAALLGVSLVWDSFVLAWTLPNLFRRLFGEGALSSAFIPTFMEVQEREGKKRALCFAERLFTYFAVLLAFLTVVVVLVCLSLTFWDLGPKYLYTAQLSAILFPYVWFICLAALLGSLLQSLESFAVPALLPVVLNLVWIGALVTGYGLGLSQRELGYTLAGTLLLGGALQFAIVWYALWRRGFSLTWDWQPQDPWVKETRRIMAPVVWSLAVLQVNVLLDRWIAELFVPRHGAVSALYYGNRLVQLPLALIGISLGVSIFPALSRQAASEKEAAFQSTLLWSGQVTSFLALPAAVGLFWLSQPIVALLFERGHFGPEATGRTAKVLALYAPSVFFYSLVHIASRAFYARKDTRTPVRVATYFVGANVLLNLILVQPLGEGGLALATSLTALGNSACLWWLLRREHHFRYNTTLAKGMGVHLLLSSAMLGGLHFLEKALTFGTDPWGRLGEVATAVVGGGALYLLFAALLKLLGWGPVFRKDSGGAL